LSMTKRQKIYKIMVQFRDEAFETVVRPVVAEMRQEPQVPADPFMACTKSWR
jgi:hypothetical protein